jgi:site-specific recombinase XerD
MKYFPNIKIQELNQRNIEDYIQSKIRNVSLHCARKHLINIKAMLNRAVTLGFINNNPANNIKRIKPPEKLPKFFDKKEFEKLITVIDNQNIKDIVLFAVNTGLRQMEILSLRKNQFYESEKLIILDNHSHITKSKKIRAIPLNNISFEIIQRRVNTSDNENIFTLDGETIKQDFIIHKFKKYIISAGLNPKLNFHSLRHTFASWLIQRNISIYSVSKLLGHSDVKTTQIYSHLTQDKLMESVKSLELF